MNEYFDNQSIKLTLAASLLIAATVLGIFLGGAL
jgi:hypothetical protein